MKVELVFEGAQKSFITNIESLPQLEDGFYLVDYDGSVLKGNVSSIFWKGSRHDIYPEIFISKEE